MAKSFKYKNNMYLDSTGVSHNKDTLKNKLDNIDNLLNNLLTNSGDNYLKFSNGILICWGNGNFTTSTGGVGFYETDITFPVPFKDKNSYSISFTQTNQWDTGKIATLGKSWSSGGSAIIFSNSPNWDFTYIAIGKWK